MSQTSQDAFAERFVRHQGRVYAYIATLLPQRSDAEDVFQQTSLILWRRWNEYDTDRPFLTWACGIAHNVVRNFLRSNRRSRVTFTDEMLDLVGNEQLEETEVQDERLQAMRNCLGSLPATQGKFVERCYAGKETVADIAQQMGVSAASLYMRLHRVRQILLECIERRLAQEGGQ